MFQPDRLEKAYIENTKREYKMIQFFSMKQLSPVSKWGRDCTCNLTLKVNNMNEGRWSDQLKDFKKALVPLSVDTLQKWTINASMNGLYKEEIEDFFILLRCDIT